MNTATAQKTVAKETMEMAFANLSSDQLKKELENIFIDTMTGSYLRQFYEKYFHQKEKEYIKLFVDVDGLKQINDTKGHKAGDKMISGVASCCQIFTRSEDILFRWGGDEFILFIKTNDLSTAHKVKQRLAATIESRGFSASIGVGFTIKEADENMYIEKKSRKSFVNRMKNYTKNLSKVFAV